MYNTSGPLADIRHIDVRIVFAELRGDPNDIWHQNIYSKSITTIWSYVIKQKLMV